MNVKRITPIITCLFLLVGCGGGSEESNQVQSNNDISFWNDNDDPFADIEKTVKDIIKDHSFPTKHIDLEKEITFYVKGSAKKISFKHRVPKVFGMNTPQKSDFISKVFSDIKKGKQLVEYLKDKVMSKPFDNYDTITYDSINEFKIDSSKIIATW